MINIFSRTLAGILAGAVVAIFAFSALAVVPAQAGSDKAKCLAMIKKMVGVEPSQKVLELCEQGKTKEAMETAMMGD